MKCQIKTQEDLELLKIQALNEAKKVFKGKATSFQEGGLNKILIPWKSDGKIKTKDMAYNTAISDSSRVEKWAEKTFGPKFSKGWTSVYTGLQDAVSIRFSFPALLEQAYKVKMGYNPPRFNSDIIPSSLTQEEIDENVDYFENDEPFTSIDNNSLQIETSEIPQVKAGEETIERIKDAMSHLGLTLETSNSVIEEFGANGVIQFSDKLIRIAEGKESGALTEEFMHYLTSVLPEGIFEEAMAEIGKYRIYKQTKEVYSQHSLYQDEFGNPNEKKIKFEAIGKLLSEFYIGTVENLEDGDLNIAKNLWDRIIDWIKSVFSGKKDVFQSIIDDWNKGILALNPEPSSRSEILAQLAFDKTQAKDLAKTLSNGLVKDDISKTSQDPNAAKLYKLRNLIETVKEKDLPLIGSYKKNIHTSKYTFAEAAKKIDNALDATDIKEGALNAINYYSSLNGITKNLSARSSDIRSMFSKGTRPWRDELTKEKIDKPLTEDDKLFLALEIEKIDKSLEIYIEQLEQFRKLWEGEEFSGLIGLINTISSTARNTISDNVSVKDKALRDTIGKAIQPKIDGYRKEQRMQELDLIKQLPHLKGRDKEVAEAKIKAIQEKIANPPISVDSILSMVTEEMPRSEFGGFFEWVSTMLEGGLTHKDQVVQFVANFLEDAHRDSKRSTEEDNGKLIEIFSSHDKKQNFLSDAYHKFSKPVTRFRYNTGLDDIEAYQEFVLLSDLEQWKFDDRMETISLLRKLAAKGVNPEKLDRIYNTVFGKALTGAQRSDYGATFQAIQKDLYDRYAQDRYIKEYRDIQKILDDTVLSTGRTVRDVRKEYIDRLHEADEELEDSITPEQTLSALDRKDLAIKDLKRLSSLYDSQGKKKQGDDLLIAETITKWQAEKLGRNNGIDDVDVYRTSNANRVKWQEQKDEIDERNNPKEKEAWYAVNVIQEIKRAFYIERADITTRISNILERTKSSKHMRLDDLWDEMFKLTKGYRDQDGVLIGTDFSDEHIEKIKEIEEEMNYIRDLIKKSTSLSKEDKDELNSLFRQLEELQSTSLTDYWNEEYEKVKMNVDTSQSAHLQEMEIARSEFFKNNTTDVTDKYEEFRTVPHYIIELNGRYYQPLYIWRQVQPKPEWIEAESPSFKWKTYQVNEKFVNPEYSTIQETIALNQSKDSHRDFKSEEYTKLSDEDKKFLKDLTKFYLDTQEKHPPYERLGLSLPRLQATGLQRTKQKLVNSKDILSDIFTRSFWSSGFHLSQTNLEQEYGEGDERFQERDIHVRSKFIGNKIALKRQDRDLFRIMLMYSTETNRAKEMRRLLPALNRLAKISAKKSTRTKSIQYEIDKRVNKVHRVDKGFMRKLSGWSDFAMHGLGLTRLGLPHFISSTIKNTANGIIQIGTNNSYLRQYSDGSISKAVVRAMRSAWWVTANQFSTTPHKEMALIRRLNIVSNLDIYDAAQNQKEFLLKAADAIGYTLAGVRRFSEVHLELIAWELVKHKYKQQTGRDLIDDYTYEGGVIQPKDGILSKEKENEITKETINMSQFIHGNFRGDNSPMAKAYFFGRLILFMRGFIYNPAIKRIGKNRILSTGQEVEGFYRVFFRLIKENPQNILSILYPKGSSLSPKEKGAIWSMYKDFTIMNLAGLALYQFAKAVKESGDDDDEEKLEWYALLMSRKIFQEASYFNPTEWVGKPVKLMFEDDSQRTRGGEVESLLYYSIGRPAMDLAAQAFLPVDYKGLRTSVDDIKRNRDPFYSQYKDNILLFDFLKAVKAKSDMEYPQSTLSAFEYYDKSIFQYEKPKHKRK